MRVTHNDGRKGVIDQTGCPLKHGIQVRWDGDPIPHIFQDRATFDRHCRVGT